MEQIHSASVTAAWTYLVGFWSLALNNSISDFVVSWKIIFSVLIVCFLVWGIAYTVAWTALNKLAHLLEKKSKAKSLIICSAVGLLTPMSVIVLFSLFPAHGKAPLFSIDSIEFLRSLILNGTIGLLSALAAWLRLAKG